jgi:hypothetical protein
VPLTAAARGPQAKPHNVRYNRDGLPKPGGMNTESGPGHIAPHEFRLLINIRWDDDSIMARGGASKLNPTALHDPAACIYTRNFEFGTPLRFYWSGDGCPGESVGVGFYLANFDAEQEPQFQRSAWYQNAITSFHVGKFSGEIHIVVDGSIRRMALHPVPYGTEALSAAGENDMELFTLPTGYTGTWLREFDGKLFVGAWNGALGEVWSWDGVTAQQELSALAAKPIASCLWRDNIVVGIDGTELRVRDVGAAPGAGLWSTVSGTVDMYPGLNSMVSYKDEVYIASSATQLYKYDGATISVARTVAGAAIESVAVGFGFLFYGYRSSTPAPTLGRTDGTSFVDAHKIFTEVTGAENVRALALYRDSLFAGVTHPAQTARILGSRGSATSGTYDIHVGSLSFATALDYGTVL